MISYKKSIFTWLKGSDYIKKNYQQKKYDDIKNYLVFCITEGYGYTQEKAMNILKSSMFLEKLKTNPNYILHYNLEYWAEIIFNGGLI